MSDVGNRTSPGLLFLMAAAVVLTGALAAFLIRSRLWLNDSPSTELTAASTQPIASGVRVRLSAGNVTLERGFPGPAFALLAGQTLDVRLPPGPFKAEFVVTFDPGSVRQARLGADFQNGSLIVMRADEPPLLSDYAGPSGRVSLTTTPVNFAHRTQQITFAFQTDGNQPARFRALWQPDDAQTVLPLPVDNDAYLADESVRGMAIAQQFNCASCHHSADARLQAALDVNPPPLLDDIGSRIRPEWIRPWLRNPQAMNRSATMPQLFHSAPDDDDQIEELIHFLVSLSGPMKESAATSPMALAGAGMLTYHAVGCMACHGPLEPVEHLPGQGHSIAYLTRAYVALGEASLKTSADHLSRFLRDPLKTWPSGRMPSMDLSEREADSIAAYLIGREGDRTESPSGQEFVVDPRKAQRGRDHFAARGCANCHAIGSDSGSIHSTLSAEPLESLAGASLERGCLSETDDVKSPRFALDASQRSALQAFLRSLPARRSLDAPLDRLASTISRLNCTACHAYQSQRGPEAAIAQYFASRAPRDPGDEGRLPPPLTDVGAKLQPAWLRDVLVNDARAHLFMNVRMPKFGGRNVGDVATEFAAAAGLWAEPDLGPETPPEFAAIGRELVGSKALNCVQCHTFAGLRATGTQGTDLATMPQRLRYEAFARWVLEPDLVQPGTQMPALFRNGSSQFTQYLEGDANRQVQAIWAYLLQAAHLPPPEILESASTRPNTALQNPADHVQEQRQEKN